MNKRIRCIMMPCPFKDIRRNPWKRLNEMPHHSQQKGKGIRYSNDNLLITLELVNGSLGTITYAANGDKKVGQRIPGYSVEVCQLG